MPLPRWGKVGLALLHAGLDLGYPWHPDLNAPGSTGISPVPTNHTGDSRVSTNDAYLEPARGRSNLTICGDTHVDRVLFDGRRATGVRAHGPDGWTEYAGREIILAAGPVFSPPILVRSGIGPADDVNGLGISLLRDLPVGRNLRDHTVVGLRIELRPEARETNRDERNLNCYIRYSSRLGGAGVNDMLITGSDLEGSTKPGWV